jgi:hypothetical protein
MHSLSVRYVYTCSACGDQRTEAFGHSPDIELRVPSPPPGWRFVAGIYFCGCHQLSIKVDTPGAESLEFKL